MQITIDSLVVALLMALAPETEQGPGQDRTLDGLLSNPPEQRSSRQPGGVLANDPSACRYYADPEARRKCTVRTGRMAQSGAAEPAPSYPETVIWLAPLEPRMPSTWGPGSAR